MMIITPMMTDPSENKAMQELLSKLMEQIFVMAGNDNLDPADVSRCVSFLGLSIITTIAPENQLQRAIEKFCDMLIDDINMVRSQSKTLTKQIIKDRALIPDLAAMVKMEIERMDMDFIDDDVRKAVDEAMDRITSGKKPN